MMTLAAIGAPSALPVARGVDEQQRRFRRRRLAAAVGGAALALALLVVATATSSSLSSSVPGGAPAAAAVAALATGGKRLLQHLAEPAQATFAVASAAVGGGRSALAAAEQQGEDPAAADADAAEASVEYLFDPVEHHSSSSFAATTGDGSVAGDPGALAATTTAANAANATAAARKSWRARPWHSRMRELFPDVLADGHEALDLSPSRHGWSNKTGVADLAAWALREDGRRLDDFFGWRTDRCAAARDPAAEAEAVRSGSAFTCAEARHPPTPFPGCHVFVNHAYRFIYIRSPKSASTSIVDVLGECGNTRTAAHLAPSCMKHSWEGALTVEEIGKVWKDYFVFGFVRNPWKRAYSLYKYLHSDGCMQ